ncbi:MAG TPA: 50S ribosomal protein L21e [Euryarchaeota archaeon]|nr:MAG: 50S ribosomal protein L21e [Thermococci archaeon]RLF97285.1 MAG: 50S ribosomal protein L21e [Thermococci archaeon]HDI10127.1 50S ribosomal protein L21e [Euryarchaeota archaeon]
MVERSKGFRSKTRKKLRKNVRERGMMPLSRIMREHSVGDRVAIVIDPSIHKGQPHPRFHGRTGKVIGKRGRAYIIEIYDGNKRKKIFARPEHLRVVQ